MRLTTIMILIICMIFNSCKKEADNDPSGIQTTVSGRFFDSYNQEGYSNLKLRVGEYHQTYGYFDNPGYYTLIGYADSTVTDINGNYSITFKTSGNGSAYFLESKTVSKNVFIGDANNAYMGNEVSTAIPQIGSSNTFNFNVLRFYYMKTRIIVSNNPFPPLYVSIGNSFYIGGVEAVKINGINKDTTVYIPIQKNLLNYHLIFDIVNPTNNIVLRNSNIPLTPILAQDTIQGGTYNVYPTTFK